MVNEILSLLQGRPSTGVCTEGTGKASLNLGFQVGISVYLAKKKEGGMKKGREKEDKNEKWRKEGREEN